MNYSNAINLFCCIKVTKNKPLLMPKEKFQMRTLTFPTQQISVEERQLHVLLDFDAIVYSSCLF